MTKKEAELFARNKLAKTGAQMMETTNKDHSSSGQAITSPRPSQTNAQKFDSFIQS